MGDDPNRMDTKDEKPEEGVWASLAQIEAAIQAIKNPTGTKDMPARTCKDLALAHPEFENGMYWIDPNQGNPVDSIEVYCDIKAHETCVIAKPNEAFKGRWADEPVSEHTWFGEELEHGFPFTYKADKVQLTFLQLLSSTAYQNVTYHCRNSVAYYDKAERNYRKAVRFMASNDLELVARRPRKARYSVVLDECKLSQDTWARTVFQFKTEKTQRLPVVDIAMVDIGADNQAFGLEIGPVCFS